MVLVDTPVWSLALRRRPQHLSSAEAEIAAHLAELIRERKVRLVGPIRQELLSGLKERSQFETLKQRLRAFPDEPLTTADYEEAAHAHNVCRSAGISGSSTDFLICAVVLGRHWQVFTTDADFEFYAKQLPLRLYNVGT